MKRSGAGSRRAAPVVERVVGVANGCPARTRCRPARCRGRGSGAGTARGQGAAGPRPRPQSGVGDPARATPRAGARVAQRPRQVDDAVDLFHHRAPAADVDEVLVLPPDLLLLVLQARVRNSGRIPASSERSAVRAARLADRTDANVAAARTSVPAAVASDAIVGQSTIQRGYGDQRRVQRGGDARRLLQPGNSMAASRILNFWTFPVTVIGNSSVTWTYRGIL